MWFRNACLLSVIMIFFIMKCKTPWCMKGKQILLQCVSDEVRRHQKLLFPSGTLALFHPRSTSMHTYVLLNYELN